VDPVLVDCIDPLHLVFQMPGPIDDTSQAIGQDAQKAADTGEQEHRRHSELNDVTEGNNLRLNLHDIPLRPVLSAPAFAPPRLPLAHAQSTG
jgi:hypothetical protein